VLTQPGEWTVRFEIDTDHSLADIPETCDATLGLMDGLGLGLKSPPPCINTNGHHTHSGADGYKKLDLARTLSVSSGSSIDTTALNSPQGSSASTGTGAASSLYAVPTSGARAARRQKIEEIFFQFTCDDQEDRTLATADLGTVIRFLGHRLSEVELQRVVQAKEADSSCLDFDEFVEMAELLDTSAERERMLKAANSKPARLFATTAKSAREREFRRVFVACMQNESGPENTTIATKDLGVVIRLLGYVLTEEELQKVADEADEDGGGSLDYEEFLSMAEHLDEVYGRRDRAGK